MAKNGRVNLFNPDTNKLFDMYDKIACSTKVTSYQDALTGNWCDNELSCKFFCKKNIDLIQRTLIQRVYQKSNHQYKIGYQCGDTLKIIMRSTYLSYAKNQPKNIEEQVNDLNNLVLDYAVDQVISEAKGYLHYLNDVSTLAIPNDLPVSTTNDDGDKYSLDQRPYIGF